MKVGNWDPAMCHHSLPLCCHWFWWSTTHSIHYARGYSIFYLKMISMPRAIIQCRALIVLDNCVFMWLRACVCVCVWAPSQRHTKRIEMEMCVIVQLGWRLLLHYHEFPELLHNAFLTCCLPKWSWTHQQSQSQMENWQPSWCLHAYLFTDLH